MTERPFFFTWTAQRGAKPLTIVGGDGCYFETDDGQRWLDFGSLSYQASLGHAHPDIINAVCEQARTLSLAPPWAVYPTKTKLAERLLALAPDGYSKVFFTLGGSEATENALKMARLVTGRLKLVSRYRSYHGATMGALTLSGDYRRLPLEPGIPGVIHVLDGLAAIEGVFEHEGPGAIAAVFLEAIRGANGVTIPDDDYWPGVRALCDTHGALLVADEVLTGFGRTGRCFGFEHFGVVPDMITVAKGLTGGYAPLGAVLVHDRVAKHFDDNVLYAGLTNYGHPLGCAAALAALEVYQRDGLFTRAAQLEPIVLGAMRELCDRIGGVNNARGVGLLAAVDVDTDDAGWDAIGRELAARRIHVHASSRRGTAIIAPPLNIDESELRSGLTIFSEAISAAIG